MSETTLEMRLQVIEEHLAAIRSEMDATRQQRDSIDDLKSDLTRVAHDAFSTAVVELEDVAPFVKTGDFWHLLKHLMRNTKAITSSLAKLESVLDFSEDAIPIGMEMFNDLMLKLNELDQKGYFDLLKEFEKAADRVTESISTEEIDDVVNKVVLPGIELLKKLADMEFIPAVSRTVDAYNNHSEEEFDSFGVLPAIRATRHTEMRRAMGRTIFFLETLARETNSATNR